MALFRRLVTLGSAAALLAAGWMVVSTSTLRRADGPDGPQAVAALSPSQPAAGASLLVPVAGVAPAQLEDTWGQERGGGTRLHRAIDIAAPAGTPVVAASAGRVEKLYLSEEGGLTAYLRTPDGQALHYYAHLQDYAPGLREGAVLPRGAPIGYVGSTGNADPASPHLHFEVLRTRPDAEWYEEAEPVNPYPLLAGRR